MGSLVGGEGKIAPLPTKRKETFLFFSRHRGGPRLTELRKGDEKGTPQAERNSWNTTFLRSRSRDKSEKFSPTEVFWWDGMHRKRDVRKRKENHWGGGGPINPFISKGLRGVLDLPCGRTGEWLAGYAA